MELPFSALVLARRARPADAAWSEELVDLARADQPYRPLRPDDAAFDVVLRGADGRLQMIYCVEASTAMTMGELEMLYPWADDPDAWATAHACAFPHDAPAGELTWDVFAERARAFAMLAGGAEVIVGRDADAVALYRGEPSDCAVRLRGDEVHDACRWRDVADMLTQAMRDPARAQPGGHV